MKKTVILILAVLPIVLLITIAFAGRILSYYSHIPVEKVQFVNEKGEEYASNYVFEINVGEEKATSIIIFPELASDKAVSYESLDAEICEIDENGSIKGIALGTTTVIVKTHDQNKQAQLSVKVKEDNVTGVRLSDTELEMKVGERATITATVEGPAAINRNVKYSTDNTSVVKVDANGNITALAQGTANVIVTTVEGGYTAKCTVTVVLGLPPLSFDFTNSDSITPSGSGYLASAVEVNVKQYLVVDDSLIDLSQVVIEIKAGATRATYNAETGVLTFTKEGVVTVWAYVGSKDAPTYSTEFKIMFNL